MTELRLIQGGKGRPRRLSDDDRDMIVNLWADAGLSVSEISAKTGASAKTVNRVVDRWIDLHCPWMSR